MSVPTEQLQSPRWPSFIGHFFGDPVVIALGIGVLILAAIDPSQVLPSLRFTGASLLSMAPFLLLAVAIAAYAKASGSDKLIAKAFSGNAVVAVVAAALMGALSPFCSCGVIPLIAAMLLASEAVGSAASCLELTVEYLKTRKQFGKLIGSYQALKHPAVDILLGLEATRSHIYHAATLFDLGEEDTDGDPA